MTKLIFITHPSVVISPNVPADEWSLSEKGIEETNRLLEKSFWKEVGAVYASTEPKAFAVAEMVREKFGLPYTEVGAIKEIDRSATGFLPYDEYMEVIEEFYRNPQVNVRGWESAEHARQRMKTAISDLMNAHQGEIVAVIGHGASGTLLACEVQGIPSTFEQDPKQTGCFMEIDWDKQNILSPWQTYAGENRELSREVTKIRPR